MEMFNAEHLQEKWDPILSYEGAPKIEDAHRKMVTAVLLENQEKFLRSKITSYMKHQPTQRLLVHQVLSVVVHLTYQTVAHQQLVSTQFLLVLFVVQCQTWSHMTLAGVQPMNGPTGLIFAMRSRKGSQTGTETFFDEVDTAFSAQDDGNDTTQGGYTGEASDGADVGFGTTSLAFGAAATVTWST